MKSTYISNLGKNDGAKPVADAVHCSEHPVFWDGLGNILHLTDGFISGILRRSQEINALLLR